MKRIRQFTISLQGDGEEKRLESWHQSWDCAAEMLNDLELQIDDGPPVVQIIDNLTGIVIARFSTINEEAIQAERGINLRRLGPEDIRWETKPLTLHRDVEDDSRNEPGDEATGSSVYANLNISDIYWTWVAGASREVPIRMSFVQRKASRQPDGIWALGYGLVSECRDWLRR